MSQLFIFSVLDEGPAELIANLPNVRSHITTEDAAQTGEYPPIVGQERCWAWQDNSSHFTREDANYLLQSSMPVGEARNWSLH